ncbi:MAG: mechanosensitive ion channel domain-containing protein [Pirellulaceae bacterium]
MNAALLDARQAAPQDSIPQSGEKRTVEQAGGAQAPEADAVPANSLPIPVQRESSQESGTVRQVGYSSESNAHQISSARMSNHETDHLSQFLDRLKAQLETAQKESELLNQQLEQLDKDALPTFNNIPVKGPVSIVRFDEVFDELEAEQARSHAAELETETLLHMLTEAEADHQARESERRKAKEAVLSGNGDAGVLELNQNLELFQIRSAITETMVQLRRTELNNAKANLAISQQRVTLLERIALDVEPRIQFTTAELEERHAAIKQTEQETQERLDRLNREVSEAHNELARISDTDSAESNPELSEQRIAWELVGEARRKRLSLINQRLADLVAARICWDYRFRNYAGVRDLERSREDRERAAAYARRLQESSDVIQLRSVEVRAELANLQTRVSDNRDSSLARWLTIQQDELALLGAAYDERLMQISQIRQLLARVVDETGKLLGDAPTTGWLDNVWSTLVHCWNFEVASIDDRPVTVRKIVGGLLLFVLGLVLAKLLSRILGRRVLPRLGANSGISQAVQSIVFYLLVIIFGLFVLEVFNVPLTVFTFMGGAVAIAAGFGSQNILNNFISGLILMAERPIRVGDLVEVNNSYGTIEHIGARSTRVRTGTNLELIIPNSKFLENNVTNFTLSDTRSRTQIDVGVAYGSPTREVEKILHQVITDCPDTFDSPEPIVLFKEFADNALQFEVHFWIRMRTMMDSERIRSMLRHEIDHALRQAGITIAFPQRDIHLDSETPIELNVRHIRRSEKEQDGLRAA